MTIQGLARSYPSLHPNLIQLYKCKAAALEEALNDPEVRSEASEILRSLIDRIEITPAPDGTGHPGGDDPGPDTESSTASLGVVVVLYGQLAGVFALAEENGAIENKRRFSLSAGARNHRELTLTVEV